ncbi:MAG TPA: 50S ribosomal protein L3 [Candidatus Saccharibacteria bacterium]|jgi:large subunit ribosomal protein L3|nr:50S ribosomal protein L3 [Candidatus Saccharibacteria bacterium]
MKALITRKLGMTSTIADDGTVQAVTLLSASPCVITQVKTDETDGYQALQIGFEETKRANKAQINHNKDAGITPKVVREFRTEDIELSEDLKVGATLTAEVFSVGDVVQVTGTSKGKGYAGTIKRHNFKRQRKTHGGKGNTRKVGSIGSMYPQHIFKGKRMAGRMGHERVTVKNLKIAIVDADRGILAVTGAVPGPKQSIVLVKGVK